MATEEIPAPPGERMTARELADWTRRLLAWALRQAEKQKALREWAENVEGNDMGKSR